MYIQINLADDLKGHKLFKTFFLLSRVYFGGQKCELIKDFDLSIPYGVTLNDDGASEYGSMECLMGGTFVSNVNGSFLIEAPYGRSFPQGSVLKVFADNTIAMFQSYASKLQTICLCRPVLKILSYHIQQLSFMNQRPCMCE